MLFRNSIKFFVFCASAKCELRTSISLEKVIWFCFCGSISSKMLSKLHYTLRCTKMSSICRNCFLVIIPLWS